MSTYKFTDEIPDDEKAHDFKEPENWDERDAEKNKLVACHDCRFFSGGVWTCSEAVGMWHKPCNEFKWW
jgi:hypothetical protein